MTTEEWRPVVGHEGYYEVSNLGGVRSVDRVNARGRWKGRPLRPATRDSGHLCVSLCRNSVCRTKNVHSLVAEAFIGPRPDGLQVAHYDGNPTNNILSNLRYATQSENLLDSVRHGTHYPTRRTTCPKGHAIDGVRYREGVRRRFCKTCKRALRQKLRLRAAGDHHQDWKDQQ